MAKGKTPTHVGVVVGVGINASQCQYSVELRETERYWISVNGIKYRKSNGSRMNDDPYAGFTLKLSSVKLISEIL